MVRRSQPAGAQGLSRPSRPIGKRPTTSGLSRSCVAVMAGCRSTRCTGRHCRSRSIARLLDAMRRSRQATRQRTPDLCTCHSPKTHGSWQMYQLRPDRRMRMGESTDFSEPVRTAGAQGNLLSCRGSTQRASMLAAILALLGLVGGAAGTFFIMDAPRRRPPAPREDRARVVGGCGDGRPNASSGCEHGKGLALSRVINPGAPGIRPSGVTLLIHQQGETMTTAAREDGRSGPTE